MHHYLLSDFVISSQSSQACLHYSFDSSLSWQACVHLPRDHWSGDFLRHRGGARGLHVLQEAIMKDEKEKRYKETIK